jgi:CubicO group peptidase (beta-lactamase class C family)
LIAERLRIDQVLGRSVDSGEVPGVVALAASDHGVIYDGAFGKRALGGDHEMALDSVFWIASMTKAVTSVAAMQLVERGLISLDEPVVNHVKELAEVQVLEGFDEVTREPKLRKPRGQITLRHLLTHRAGFSYPIWNADMARYCNFTHTPGIGECRRVSLMTPLVFDPGERWEYGIGIDWAGQIVERLSGQDLARYVSEHIFEPLNMPDTRFVLEPAQEQRRAAMHRRQPDGSLKVVSFNMPRVPEFYMGGGGLYSTGPDYLRFLRMLLGNGALDGVRVLSDNTVGEMNRNQIGELTVKLLASVEPDSSNDAEFFPGMLKKWGLAYMMNTLDAPVGRSAGSLAWAGLANTYYWIDPTRRVTAVILTQVLPFADTRVLMLVEDFERAIYASASSD